MSDDKEWKEAADNPKLWQAAAREFTLAGNYLLDWHDPPDSPDQGSDLSSGSDGATVPMLVLYAAAVENLLKGLLVARGESLIADGQLIGEFKGHNLKAYAERAGVQLEAQHVELLGHLSDVAWAGRYPIGKTPTSHPNARHLDCPDDVKRVWSILELLDDAVRSTGKACLAPFDYRQRIRLPVSLAAQLE